MKKTMLNSTTFPSAGLLTLVLVILVGVSDAYGDLLFLRATEDKAAYVKEPSMYNRVILPPGRAIETVYVERKPALAIPLGEIETVLIEKEKVFRGERIVDFVYRATFSLNKQGFEKFRAFAQKYDQQLFDMRINNQRLNIIILVGPFADNQLAVGLMERNIDRLKEIFSPIKNKTTWQ